MSRKIAAIQLTLLAAISPFSDSIAEDDEFAGGLVSANAYRGYVQELRNSWFDEDYDIQQAAFALGYSAGVHDYAASLARVCSPDDVLLKEVVIEAYDRINDERGGRSAGGVWNGNRYSRTAGLIAAAPIESRLSWAFPCDDDAESGRNFVSLEDYESSLSHFDSFVRGSEYDEHEAAFTLAYAVGVYDLATSQETICAPPTLLMLNIPTLGIESADSEDIRADSANAADTLGRALLEAFPCGEG